MRIALVGYGRMGPEIRAVAEARGHAISQIFDISRPPRQEIDPSADVIIDFSTAAAVPDTLRWAAKWQIPVVEGTTGWREEEVDLSAIPGLTMVYSPNFSPGVYRFTKLVEMAGRLFAGNDYDVYVHEWHHAGKADSPSGTARRLAEVLLSVMPSKTEILAETSHGRIPGNRLHVTSTRVGRVPGTHEVGFDSRGDAVILRHQAWGRESFAYGAVLAAEWIQGKKGIFTMDEFMSGISRQGKE
jgi:4-hydroxy-tetrahydrodipicolinate reductase